MNGQLKKSNATCRSSRNLRLSAISLILLLLLGSAPRSYADEESPIDSEVVAASEPQVDFRVISTRRCPQDGYSLCTPEQYDYYRLDEKSQWQSGDLNEFLESLNADNPIAFFVHGNLVTWDTAFREGWQAANAMKPVAPRGSKLTVVMFTWESDRQSPLPSIDVEIKASRADTTGFYLAQLLQKLSPETHASLLGHSHGARAVAGALQLLGGGVVAGRALPGSSSPELLPRLRGVFLAGTLDHNSLASGKDYDRILNSAESVLNIRNSQDSILALYPLRMPFAESAMGKVGLKNRDWQRLGANQSRVQQMDVADIIGSSHDWAEYFRAPGITVVIAQHVYVSK